MRRWQWFFLAIFAVLLAGCGSQHHVNPNTPVKVTLPTGKPGLRFAEPHGGTCTTRNPPAASECVRQAMEAEGIHLAAPLAEFVESECADWSQWQGWYPQTIGLHCVIIQAAYGLNVEPSLHEQIRDARAHGLPYGVYDFGEPGVSGASEMAFIHELEPRAPLGYWFDAEVDGAFWRSCEFTSEAQNLGVRIFGVFSYPGGYAAGGGTHCAGRLWVSEWGVFGPIPFGGYPASAIVLWQYTGNGDRFGVTTDLDQNRGLIELAEQPKPKPKPPPSRHQLEKQLHSDLATRTTLRALEATHDCRMPPYHHPLPDTHAYAHACSVWIPQGRGVDKQIAKLERELR
jgi:GH25 family lysozyme M1 (1,4-beta-N-acetylmuramidase)